MLRVVVDEKEWVVLEIVVVVEVAVQEWERKTVILIN